MSGKELETLRQTIKDRIRFEDEQEKEIEKLKEDKERLELERDEWKEETHNCNATIESLLKSKNEKVC